MNEINKSIEEVHKSIGEVNQSIDAIRLSIKKANNDITCATLSLKNTRFYILTAHAIIAGMLAISFGIMLTPELGIIAFVISYIITAICLLIAAIFYSVYQLNENKIKKLKASGA